MAGGAGLGARRYHVAVQQQSPGSRSAPGEDTPIDASRPKVLYKVGGAALGALHWGHSTTA